MASVRQKKPKLVALLLVLEVVFIILFAVTADYEDSAKPSVSLLIKGHGSDHVGSDNHSDTEDHVMAEPGPSVPKPEPVIPEPGPIATYYAMFQDVHVMMFIGFGFLMTFLRRYGFSSVGLNMVVAAVAIQWAMLVGGYLHGHGGKVHIGIVSMLTADFASAAVLITMGALLGKTSPIQLIVICILEIVVFAVNEWVGLSVLKVVDVGGSMFVHAFGAYFGLTVSRVLYRDDVAKSEKEGSVYHSDIFAMVGTVFLWLYWPSFNSALAVEDAQHRAVINTYLALAACCVVSFAVSSLTDPHGKFDMVHVQNATLAGGVAVGTSADMMIGAYGALLIGSSAGCLSVIGYKYITPFLASRLKIHDTCGVNNLHGMPAIMAAIAGCIASLLADTDDYGYTLYRQFPARMPSNESSEEFKAIHAYVGGEPGEGRTASQQAGYQIAALAVTLLVAIAGGLLTGLLVRFVPLDQPTGGALFEDQNNWEVPEDPEAPAHGVPLLHDKGNLETGFSAD